MSSPSRLLSYALPAILLAGAVAYVSCKSVSTTMGWDKKLSAVVNQPKDPAIARQELRIRTDYIPAGKFGRRMHRPMQPRYITIHSTQNPTGDAFDHARALKNGALKGGVIGYLCWHFSVQQDAIIQHLPTSEQGEHADFDGPGNRFSIGIEMCEHQGNDLATTIDRTARLTASLMQEFSIPIENVRAHYHWPRKGYDKPNKNCPHFLLDRGEPGHDWQWFLNRVSAYRQQFDTFYELQRQQNQSAPIEPAPVSAGEQVI